MAHGQPDFGMYAPKTNVFGQADLGELAVRLGSIVRFDRRGEVVWMDDFEAPRLKWTKSLGGTSTIALDTVYPFSGSQCAKFSISAGVGDAAFMYREVGHLISDRIGSEFVFCNIDPGLAIYSAITRYETTYYDIAIVKLDFSNGKVYIYTALGVFTLYMTSSITGILLQPYFPIKLVVDFDTRTYDRLLLQGKWYDLSAYSIPRADAAGWPRLRQWIEAITMGGGGGTTYIDDVILTQDEP